MLASVVVVVRQYNYGGIAKEFAMLALPLAGTAGAACRWDAPVPEQVNLALALNNQNGDGAICGDRGGHLWQAVDQRRDAIDVVDPLARSIWIRVRCLMPSSASILEDE